MFSLGAMASICSYAHVFSCLEGTSGGRGGGGAIAPQILLYFFFFWGGGVFQPGKNTFWKEYIFKSSFCLSPFPPPPTYRDLALGFHPPPPFIILPLPLDSNKWDIYAYLRFMPVRVSIMLLMMLLKANFEGLMSQTLIACRAMKVSFSFWWKHCLKVESMLLTYKSRRDCMW